MAVEHLAEAIRLRESGRLDEARALLIRLGAEHAESERTLREGGERFPDFPPCGSSTHRLYTTSARPARRSASSSTCWLETTDDPTILRYRRSLSACADDLDRSWLS